PVTGDWTIGDNTTLANQTVTLRGNLTIVPGGRLTLLNVTLQVFSDMNTVHGILVMANGTLELSDLDRTSSTKGDRTVLMRGNPAFGYSFLAEKDSLIFIEYSLLSGMGANGGTGGALFKTSGFKLIGTTFTDGYEYCLMLDGSEDSVVDSCDFELGKDGLVLRDCVNITVDDSSIEDNDRIGLVIDECEGTVVTNSNISFNGREGVQVVGGSKNEVDNTRIFRNDRGVVLESATWFTLSRCTVSSPMKEGMFISVGCHNVSIEQTTIRNTGRSGVEADGADNLTILGSIIENCEHYGVRLLNGSRSVSIAMSAEHNEYDGLHIEGARDIVIQGSDFRNNGYNGMFIIDAKNVTVRNSSFMNNSYDGLNCDSVRDAIIDDCTSEMNGYRGVNIQAGSHDIRIIGGGFNENTRSGLGIDSARSITVDGVTMW
ncbi:MAG: right-handed parallel beta-helix repeat-containing protein, partial [Thermoplasmata archaeon]|nr:right-handed parallel beta-helix repeat-containing protein [Thermoplasmata archaeon]